MTATTSALAPLQPAFSNAERLALADFLAGYRGLTREAYALDLHRRASPPGGDGGQVELPPSDSGSRS